MLRLLSSAVAIAAFCGLLATGWYASSSLPAAAQVADAESQRRPELPPSPLLPPDSTTESDSQTHVVAPGDTLPPATSPDLPPAGDVEPDLENDPVFQELKEMLSRGELGGSPPTRSYVRDGALSSDRYHAAELILRAARLIERSRRQSAEPESDVKRVENLRQIAGELLP